MLGLPKLLRDILQAIHFESSLFATFSVNPKFSLEFLSLISIQSGEPCCALKYLCDKLAYRKANF